MPDPIKTMSELVKVQKKIFVCLQDIDKNLKIIHETYIKYFEGLQNSFTGGYEIKDTETGETIFRKDKK